MAFFDLNVPYAAQSPSGQSSSRAKLVTKALELGYAGVAYNRTIHGVMSDHDRCSIPHLTLPSLLQHCPHLLSAVNLHRDLLGHPRAAPFRQYTRLTVCVESQSQAQALNSGNPVLKTYDLVAVKPLNQSAFDLACEKLEVDIIAIDFSEKLHFRLKMPMVKAAIKRGVCFEITYANLIADVQARKQIITNAKLLVDWPRGKNLIVSSAAPTANEFRGPYDVANLMSLLGLSMERAKAAISRNCRTLISNAVRKKHFVKEAIRIEVLPSGQETDKKKPWSSELFKWDPISSGDGDLLLEDLAKSFATSRKNKAIDFSSVLDSKPSFGFQVEDVLPTTELVMSHSVASDETIVSASEAIEKSVVTAEVPEEHKGLYVPQSGQAPVRDGLLDQKMFHCENTQKSYSPCASIDAVQIKAPTLTSEAKMKNVDGTNGNFGLITTESHDFQSQMCVTNRELNAVPANDNLTFPALGTGSEAACTASSEVEVSTNYPDTDVPAPQKEDMCANGSDTQRHLIAEIQTEVDVESKGEKLFLLNSPSVKISDTKLVQEYGDDAVRLANGPVVESNDMNASDDYSVVTHGSEEVMMEEKEHGKAGTEMKYPTLVRDISGKSRRKRKTSHQMQVFPLTRLMHLIPVKKARKR